MSQPAINIAYMIANDNAVANQYMRPGTNMGDAENVTWIDPMDDMVSAANELALRAAISLTNFGDWGNGPIGTPCITCTQPRISYPDLSNVNRSITQRVTATITESRYVYQTNLGWLFGGFATILAACILVAPMYWGCWRLARCHTMNPLETAKAFDAPVLRKANAFESPTEWSRPMKEMRIRYGKESGKTEDGVDSQTMLEEQQDKSAYHETRIRPLMVSDGASSSFRDADLAKGGIPKFYKVH